MPEQPLISPILTAEARARLYARATHLAVLTIGYNLVEGLVSIGFGAKDESLALLGFGSDSFIEMSVPVTGRPGPGGGAAARFQIASGAPPEQPLLCVPGNRRRPFLSPAIRIFRSDR
jgi:hypothetical protein